MMTLVCGDSHKTDGNIIPVLNRVCFSQVQEEKNASGVTDTGSMTATW